MDYRFPAKVKSRYRNWSGISRKKPLTRAHYCGTLYTVDRDTIQPHRGKEIGQMAENTELECYFCGDPLTKDGADFQIDEHDEDRAWHTDCIEQAEDQIGSRGMALLEFLRGDDPDLLPDDVDGDDETWTCYRTSYLVLTDGEANEKAKDGAESYLDSSVLPRVPADLQLYFDEKRWVDDAVTHDAREFWIGSKAEDDICSSYDGEQYYIYKR